MGDFAAVAAADAAAFHVGHRVFLQGVAAVFHRQRRAARQADAGVVAGADVRGHAEAFLHHALAFLDRLVEQRLDAALLVQHAFGLRNDDLGTLDIGACAPISRPRRARHGRWGCWWNGRGSRRETTGCPARRSPRRRSCRR
ncbi:hypothetical protein G6F40_015668 [Rhizopus arrhizus]|nr:hypothetical protein G6F40_015668 [Rhizopus arrhizus]